MSDKKPNKIVIAIMALLIVVLAVNFFLLKKKGADDPSSVLAYETTMKPEGADAAATDTPAPAEAGQPSVSDEAAIASTASGLVDLGKALGDRILGDVNAPLKISEHASLTCSHCAHFHKETFPKLKEQYLDTKKAYLVFSDFPLNEPAMRATMIARCLPESQFFDFISELFSKQEEWAFEADYYKTWLQRVATEKGMTPELFEACFNSKELEDGIKARMKSVQEQWHIESTPSFVLNNSTVVSGALKFEDFEKVLNEAASKPATTEAAPADAVAPAAEPAAETPTTPESTDEAAPESAKAPGEE